HHRSAGEDTSDVGRRQQVGGEAGGELVETVFGQLQPERPVGGGCIHVLSFVSGRQPHSRRRIETPWNRICHSPCGSDPRGLTRPAGEKYPKERNGVKWNQSSPGSLAGSPPAVRTMPQRRGSSRGSVTLPVTAAGPRRKSGKGRNLSLGSNRLLT